MRALIDPKLGRSSSGKEWALKALHPADPLTEVRGVPDQSALPTTMLNWQMESVVAPAAGASGTWSCDLTMVPDPCSFGCAAKTDSLGVTTQQFVNTQLGATYQAAFQALNGNGDRWRLAYMGLTVYQDGPALSDQGSVAAAVIPVDPLIMSTSYFDAGQQEQHTSRNAIAFTTNSMADFETLVRMPNAYMGQSKHGVYMPLKLSTNHQNWHGQFDVLQDGTAWTLDGGQNGRVVTKDGAINSGWPYYGCQCCWYSTTGHYFSGTSTQRMFPCNQNWGRLCFQNLSVASRLVLVWRVGYEVQCNPLSMYAAYLKLSPPHDPLAVEEYFAIARELKDAYPAEYNDRGKLWDVIKAAMRTALPFISAAGPIGALVGGIGSAIMGTGKTLSALKRATTKPPSEGRAEMRDKPPAAAIERAVEAQHTVVVAAKPKRLRPQKPPKRASMRKGGKAVRINPSPKRPVRKATLTLAQLRAGPRRVRPGK